MMAVFSVYLLLVALHNALGSVIVVNPPTNQFRAINSSENVTFSCNVTGAAGGNTLPFRNAVWSVLQLQIPNDQDSPLQRNFASIGIFVDVKEQGITELTITSEARTLYFTDTPPTPNITIMCSAFTDGNLPVGEDGNQINVTTFG